MKKYMFTDDSWYDQPPCDCCLGGWVEAYNSEQVAWNFGTAFDLEDCYIQAIATEKGWQSWCDIPDHLHVMSEDELKVIADEMGIEVEIVS